MGAAKKLPHPWLDFKMGAASEEVAEFWQRAHTPVWVVEVSYVFAGQHRTASENVRAPVASNAAEDGYRHFNSQGLRGLRVGSVRLADPVADLRLGLNG